MKLSTHSGFAVPHQWGIPDHSTQVADLLEVSTFNLRGKRIDFPCRLHIGQPTQYDPRAIHKRNFRSNTLAFANRKDEAERGSSNTCSDHVLPLECNGSSNHPDVEVDVSLTQSQPDISGSAEYLANEGSLLDKLKAVHLHVLASEQWNASRLKLSHRNYFMSATNLIHHLALKCLDVKQLKEDLSSTGLLNLEIINSNVLASLSAAIQLVENLNLNLRTTKENIRTEICSHGSSGELKTGIFTINATRQKASSNRELLLGSFRDGRTTHIMVTVGQEAVENESHITNLLKAGTSIIRINCAHGNPTVWSEIIRRVKTSSQMLEMPCRILMDLAGPKLRTGHLKSGPCVMKLSPKRDAAGNVILPAQIWLSSKGVSPPAHFSPDGMLFIDNQENLAKLEIGDTVRFHDARGKKRRLKISKKFHVFTSTGYVVECDMTAYVQSGTEMYIKRKKGNFLVGRVVDVPAKEPFVRLRVGDLLTITRDSTSTQEESFMLTSGAPKVTCPSGYLFDSVKPGESIAFDDGKIWGIIQGTSISEIVVSITHAGPRGTKLGSEKSINIPDSNIRFQGLTSKDLVDLEFVASHADMVGISFVRDVCDIVLLQQELEKRRLNKLGIVLKIETRSGFEKLPQMLLEAMKSPNPLGVMIARGDLAVECGWEKLADIQEEILSICTAAHVPVIWATQVLESLVKSGVPTRAEITDVASGRRSSCIMLNKGKHVVEAVSTLDTMLRANSMQVKSELKPIVLSSHLV